MWWCRQRKALGDFFESWKRGRLYDQLSRLAQCYEKRYLIIEAFDLSLFTKPMLVYNILLQCHLNFGVTFLFTRSKEETAGVIGLLARKPVVCNKSSSHSPPPKLRRMLTADERRIMMLCCIQGIGRKKAGKIMKNMKSLCNFFTADNTTLKTKCGIGKRIAAEIRELLD